MRRTEYPRPNFKREKWKCLNGVWKFYYGNKKTEIEVPFVCQSQLSGIGERITEDFVVYENEFTVPKEWKGEEIRINFGAVDYRCCVYINIWVSILQFFDTFWCCNQANKLDISSATFFK